MRATCGVLVLLLAVLSDATFAQEPAQSMGQTVYLPVYSHVYHGELDKKGQPAQTLLSTHVSIRNTDPAQAIRLTGARYYNTQGNLVRSYLVNPVPVPPMGTYELFVPRTDTAGGSGANFLLTWTAEAPVNLPVIEALHADIREARTLMLHTSGVAIKSR